MMLGIEKQAMKEYLFYAGYIALWGLNWYYDESDSSMALSSNLLQNEAGEIFNPYCYSYLTGSTIVPLPPFCRHLSI